MTSKGNNKAQESCRIALVGSHEMRLGKILELLLTEPDMQQLAANDDSETVNVKVAYLPCVAKFDSYPDDNGKQIRYLASVDYHPELLPVPAQNELPSSLLEIFDEATIENSRTGEPLFPHGIAGVAIGSGIEGEESVNMISKYFSMMMMQSTAGGDDDDDQKRKLVVQCVQPMSGYASMHDELAAFKDLDKKQKEEATRQRTMGPAKMAKFAFDFAQDIVQDALQKRRVRQEVAQHQHVEAATQVQANNNTILEEPDLPYQVVDPNKDCFSCRKCRTVIFGQDDMQDPPHVPSQHQFGYRKHGGGATGDCQSFFLHDVMDWMKSGSSGRSSSSAAVGDEGRIHCPKCDTKIGTLHWSGAQCSCGTWVVPAIQIPKSKVDLVPPQTQQGLLPPPTGTVVSRPVVMPVQQVQQPL